MDWRIFSAGELLQTSHSRGPPVEVAMSTALAEMSGPEVEHKGWLKDFNAQNHGGSQQTSKVKLIKHLFILVAKTQV